jgi:FkbM family methyltransferase
MRALERYLGPGAVFLDVGANEGVHSVYAACLVEAAGTVLAVEPQSRLQAVIDRNFALNGLRNYRLWACALSDHDDATLDLNLYPGLNTGSSSIVARYRFCRSLERVRTKTASALIAESGVDKVDLVKVDVEGFEPEVVRGLLPALRERRVRVLSRPHPGPPRAERRRYPPAGAGCWHALPSVGRPERLCDLCADLMSPAPILRPLDWTSPALPLDDPAYVAAPTPHMIHDVPLLGWRRNKAGSRSLTSRVCAASQGRSARPASRSQRWSASQPWHNPGVGARRALQAFSAAAIIDFASAGIRPRRLKRTVLKPACSRRAPSECSDQNLMWPWSLSGW